MMAASCRLPGRPSPQPVSASASRCRTPGMAGRLPSPPGRCHRASRTSACTVLDHQILAVLTVSAGCRLAAAVSSPGPGRVQGHGEGMEVPAGFPAYLPAGRGLIGRVIVVPFQLRPAERGVAAASAAGVAAAWQRGAAGGAGAGHGGDPGGPGRGSARCGPGEGSWPGTAGSWLGAAMAGRHCVAMAGRLGVAGATGARATGLGIARAGGPGTSAVPKPGGPVVHLKHAGMLWPDLDLHVEPPLLPVVSRAGAGDFPWGRTRRAGRSASCGPGSCGKRGGLWCCRPAYPALAVAVLRARAHRVWVRSSHRPGRESQPDKQAVNVRPIYRLSRRGVWTIPASFVSTGRGSRSPS